MVAADMEVRAGGGIIKRKNKDLLELRENG